MTPTLTHIADFRIDVGAPITIGETPEGLRRVVPILGGAITGPRLFGRVLPAGADYQVIRADGLRAWTPATPPSWMTARCSISSTPESASARRR